MTLWHNHTHHSFAVIPAVDSYKLPSTYCQSQILDVRLAVEVSIHTAAPVYDCSKCCLRVHTAVLLHGWLQILDMWHAVEALHGVHADALKRAISIDKGRHIIRVNRGPGKRQCRVEVGSLMQARPPHAKYPSWK